VTSSWFLIPHWTTMHGQPHIKCIYVFYYRQQMEKSGQFNPLNAELNPICHLLALLGAHHIFHVRELKVNVSCRRIPTIWGPGWSWCSSNRITFPPRTHFLGHLSCSFVTASTELPHAHRFPCCYSSMSSLPVWVTQHHGGSRVECLVVVEKTNAGAEATLATTMGQTCW